jgi:hypothetical protein
VKVARTVLKERCPQAIEASTLIKILQDDAVALMKSQFQNLEILPFSG